MVTFGCAMAVIEEKNPNKQLESEQSVDGSGIQRTCMLTREDIFLRRSGLTSPGLSCKPVPELDEVDGSIWTYT